MQFISHDRTAPIDAVAFNFASRLTEICTGEPIDIAYTIDKNVWNGKETLQLKIKDIITA